MKDTRIDSDSLREALGRLNAAIMMVRNRDDADYMFACKDGWAWIGRHSGGRIAWVRIGEGFDFAPFFMSLGDIQRFAHRFCFVQDLASGNVFIDERKCGSISDFADMLLPEPVARFDYANFYAFTLNAEEALPSMPSECLVGIRDGQIIAHDKSTLIWDIDFPTQAYEPGFDFCEFTIEEIKAASSASGDAQLVRLGAKYGLMFDDMFFVRSPIGDISTKKLSEIKTHAASYVVGAERIADAIKRARRHYKSARFMCLWLTLDKVWALEDEAGKVLAEGKCSSISAGAKPVLVLLDGFRFERALRHMGFYQPIEFRLADLGALQNIVVMTQETFKRQTVFVCPLFDASKPLY